MMDYSNWCENDWEIDMMAGGLLDGTDELQLQGLIEYGCPDGMVDMEKYKLTSQAREELVREYVPHRSPNMNMRSNDRALRRSKDIRPKQLYYNNDERRQIDRLRSLLSQEGLKNVQDRLDRSGLRRGITCLFYGAPGTGKTESVLQLARETGRDIMQIDIAGLRDKFVGESEKNIKSVFNRYRDLCKGCERMPILFFNEADAIINSRLENTQSSVEKMDNAMQNIILQELENLDGILIATTNLTGNLDKAFDRRFLFKIEFSKPGEDAKRAIWHEMLPEISSDDCLALAREFEFSGGQIENIARKCKIEYAISDRLPDLDGIREFCQEEYLNRNSRGRIGF